MCFTVVLSQPPRTRNFYDKFSFLLEIREIQLVCAHTLYFVLSSPRSQAQRIINSARGIHVLKRNWVRKIKLSFLFRTPHDPNLQRFIWRRHALTHPDGLQHGGRNPTETSVTEFCYKSVNLSLEELKNIKITLFLIHEILGRNKSLFETNMTAPSAVM